MTGWRGEASPPGRPNDPAPGGSGRGPNDSRPEPDWRELLRRYAADVWRAAASPDAQVDLVRSLEPVLGGGTQAALDLVAAFALGRRQQATDAGGEPDLAGLEVILAGLGAGLGGAGEEQAGPPPAASPQIIQSELWQILHKVRESAELSYSRELDLAELDRRILFLLQNTGPRVPAEISGAVGVDKAQVSRSVRRLLELNVVERQQIRAPLRLTRKGEALAKRLLRLAELRNRELGFGIDDDELAEFLEVIDLLLDRAMALYDRERDISQAPERAASEPPADERRSAEPIAMDRSRIVSPLMTLSSYFSRSGALAFKRLTGLSNFEAFVLSEIGMDPPIEWPALVAALQRDHSQAGRTVKALIDRGLVERAGKPGRRHGSFRPTAEGARLHKVIHDAGRERSAFLLAPLEDDRRRRFLATFDKIRRNAQAQLERERAFADLAGG